MTNGTWPRVVGLAVAAIVLLVLAAVAPVLYPNAAHPVALIFAALGGIAAVVGGFSVPGWFHGRVTIERLSADQDAPTGAPQHRGDM